MKGKRSKRYPVPSGTQFTEGGETFTLVGPIDEATFMSIGNRWPKANRRPRNRKGSPFTFKGEENYIWIIVDEFGYYVAKVGAVVLDDVIGDAGSFTIGGMPKHPKTYGVDYRGRGFNTMLDEKRMPFIKNIAESKKIPIVLDLSNDTENRLAKYQSDGFEIVMNAEEKHPNIPEKYHNILESKNRTYAIYVPDSLKADDPAMKKAWEILKSRMSSKAKKLTDEIMADGRERSVKEIISLMYGLIRSDSMSQEDKQFLQEMNLKLICQKIENM